MAQGISSIKTVDRKDRTGQDRTGQDRTGQDRTGQDRTGHLPVMSCHVMVTFVRWENRP